MRGLHVRTAAALLATAMLGSPAFAENGNGRGGGNGHGGGNQSGADASGASGMGPGLMKADGESARDFSPARMEGVARDHAPGRLMQAADNGDDDEVEADTTASVAASNYGTLISLLRSGRSDLASLSDDAGVTIIQVEDVVPNGNRRALDNALDARADEIAELREQLDALELDELAEVDPEAVVAAELDLDGTLVVYVDD